MASFAPGMALATVVAPEEPQYREYNATTAQSDEQLLAGYQPRNRGCDYLEDFLNPVTLKYKAELVKKVLNGFGPFAKTEFDAIAFSGQSGSLIAPIVAMLMGKSLIMVRKKGTRTHSSYRVEGDKAARKYIILDDLTSSGDTIRYIQESMRDEGYAHVEYVGMLSVGNLCERVIAYQEKSHSGLDPKPYPLNHTPKLQEEENLRRERRKARQDEIEREAKAETIRLAALRKEREARGIVEPTPEAPETSEIIAEREGTLPNFWGFPKSPIMFRAVFGPPPNEVMRFRDGEIVYDMKQPDGSVMTVDTNFDPVPV